MTLAGPIAVPLNDAYRFGRGDGPALQPGTLGWTADDLSDPLVRRLWEAGRFEILNGVLTLMPPAFFDGGQVTDALKFLARAYFQSRGLRVLTSGEVDIAIGASRVLKADGVVIAGEDVDRFESLRFPPPDTHWMDNLLTLPPTIVIESVSQGHEAHDRVTKRAWYAELGVPNYWIVDAFGRTLECLRWAKGAYEVDAAGAGEDVVRPGAFEGLEIALRAVWGA